MGMIVPEARYAMTVRSLLLAAGGPGGTLSPPVDPGQGLGGGPWGEASGKLWKYCILQHQKWTENKCFFTFYRLIFFLNFGSL